MDSTSGGTVNVARGAHSFGRIGNVVAQSETPVNFGSETGGGIKGYIPTMKVHGTVPCGLVERPRKFTELNFEGLQLKVLFSLVVLGMSWFLTEMVPSG
jgi:hypothetical protein